MAGIWLTTAAAKAFSELQETAPSLAAAVADAINEIPAKQGHRLTLPGAPLAEPFLAREPRDPDAPAVIYRRATTDEAGDWLVVSLMKRDDYRAARQAERELATFPPAVRDMVYAAVAGTIPSVAAGSGPLSSSPSGAIPAVGPGSPPPAN